MSESVNTIKVRCFRSNPEVHAESWYDEYRVPLNVQMSVLNVLEHIYENIDHTLAYPRSCFHGACGVCKVRVNGKVCLACATSASDEMTIEPAIMGRQGRD